MIRSEDRDIKLSDHSEPQTARLYTWKDYSGAIVIPLPLVLRTRELDAFVDRIAEIFDELPNADMIDRLLLVDKGTVSSADEVFQSGGERWATLGVGEGEENLRLQVQSAWANVLFSALPIERYLFHLAEKLVAAGAHANLRDGWISGITGILQNPSAVLEGTAPIRNAVLLKALSEGLKFGVTDEVDSRFNTWHELFTKLTAGSAVVTEQALLAIINGACTQEHKDVATKLLLHLAGDSPLELVKNIVCLDFTSEPLGDTVVRKLKYIQSLEELTLDGGMFSSPSLRHLIYLPKLRMLSVQRTKTSDNAIAHLSKSPTLEVLDCSDTSLSDASVDLFKLFESLKVLNISGTSIGADKLAELKQSNPRLEVISNE